MVLSGYWSDWRGGWEISFRQRDPLVVTLHDALDRLEELEKEASDD